MRILLAFAVEAEFTHWGRLQDWNSGLVDGVAVRRSQIGPATLDCVVTGPGCESAGGTVRQLLSSHYDVCVAAGFAGATKAGYGIGVVLVPRGVQKLGAPRRIACAAGLVDRAQSTGATFVDTFLTTDHVIARVAEKVQLASQAAAVDMESFAILAAAEECGVPAVAVRAISDVSGRELPGFLGHLVGSDGKVRLGRLILNLALHPGDIPAMVRLGRDSNAAGRALAQFLGGFLADLARSHSLRQEEQFIEVSAT